MTISPRYRDRTQPVAARVDDLLARMTLDEKLAQLGACWSYDLTDGAAFDAAKAAALLHHGIGQITRIGGATNLAPAASAALANAIQRFLIERTRLGIPAIVHEECCGGYMARSATIFPQSLGVAATWNPALVEQMTTVIRRQMRAVGAHLALAPVLDVTHEPRWGRTEETFGEDPYLAAALGVAYVRGLQTDDLTHGVAATAKHFLAQGMPEGGRNWSLVHAPLREVYEFHLPPFEAAIKEARLASVMNAYHEIDGVPCAASHDLLTGLLRHTLGFDGIVVSDYWAIPMIAAYHHVAVDEADAAQQAFAAGIDVELPSTHCYGTPLREMIDQGTVDPALIDQAVRRVLAIKFALGLFEQPYVEPADAAAVFDTPEQRVLARSIAAQSIVLLKNNALLPLCKNIGTIAVIGPNADTARNLYGDYSYVAHLETMRELAANPEQLTGAPARHVSLEGAIIDTVTVLDGIKQAVGDQTQVLYAKGCDVLGEARDGFDEAVAVARRADVAVLVLGGKSGLTSDCTSGESCDRAELGLPGVQEDLVRAIHATGTPVVAVLIDGRPLAVPWLAEHAGALLHAWLPGEEGGSAVADVLFGAVNPGGRLPISVPRSAGQLPVYYNHKPSGGRSHWKNSYIDQPTTPLFSFGHGLSYTSFEWSDLAIDRSEVGSHDNVAISLTVRNTGACAGDEVVQLYVHDVLASVTRPLKQLKGFVRVTLQPGEAYRITWTLAVTQLGLYDRAMRFVVEPGEVELMVGASAGDIRLQGTITIVGETAEIGADKTLFSTATITRIA